MFKSHSHGEDAGTDATIIKDLITDDRVRCGVHDEPDIGFNTTDFDVGFVSSQNLSGIVVIVIDKWFNTDSCGFALVGYLLV